jgi:hypothetical protein
VTANAFAIAADLWTTRSRRKSYLTDPQAWAEDKLKAFLWSKQREIIQSVVFNRRTVVVSSHGIGKSFIAGMLAAWWIDTHPASEAIVVTTAPTYRQVHGILWEEIRKQHRRGDLPGRVLMTDQWYIGESLVGEGRKPADHDSDGFQGTHRRYVLVILDEGCGVPENLYTGAESITTNEHCRIVAIGNPDNPIGPFADATKPGSGWNVVNVGTFDTPNFTDEEIPEELRDLLPSRKWQEDCLKKWGEDSPLYQSKVLGKFPKSSENTLIPLDWIIAAQERDLVLPRYGAENKLGVDVARFGSDRSVIYHNHGGRFRLLSDTNGEPTTATAGRAIVAWREVRATDIQVDGVGVGAGVVDTLDEDGYPVVDMQAGSGTSQPKRFVNARAEWYWHLREMFERGEADLDPEDTELASQLASLRYVFSRRGQIQIESKDDMRKRGMPSPDRADACMLSQAWEIDTKVSDEIGAAY